MNWTADDLAALSMLYDYNPETGAFVWKVKRRGPNEPGAEAGSVAGRGYVYVQYRRRAILAHRLAWFICHSEMPVEQIDHINGVKTDNRLSNLRQATHSENICNQRSRKDNVSGYRGVGRNGRKWRAEIKKDGRVYRLGRFETAEMAAAAYAEAAARLHGEFAYPAASLARKVAQMAGEESQAVTARTAREGAEA